MSVDFLLTALETNEISTEIFQPEANKLYKVAKTKGLSSKELSTILSVLHEFDFADNDCECLIRCLIPKKVLPQSLVRKIILWIFTNYDVEGQERKTECLLIWIASLLDFDLINYGAMDESYHVFHSLLPVFPKPISHILYVLTKSEDVTLGCIEEVQNLLLTFYKGSHLCALLQRYKELNPEYSYIKVPSYTKNDKVFSYNDTFYIDLRTALRNVKKLDENVPTESMVVPLKKLKLFEERLLPDAYYLPNEVRSQQGQCYIHNISKGAHLGKNFRNLITPSHTLTLMKNEVGIYVLMFSDRSLQDNFFYNLYAVLEKSFITQADEVSRKEKEKLLNNAIVLQLMFQQGFLCVSKFLSKYLERWDGVEFKSEIFMLLEWFVFQSTSDLQKYLLKPLYSLFIIDNGDANMKCDILHCLTNLVVNLFFMMMKESHNWRYLYKENIIHTREQLIPVLKNFSKFFSHLCKHGLNQYPCNAKILKIAIDFYTKMDKLEDEGFSIRTIVSSNVLYHTLLSLNAELLNEVCALMPNYRKKIKAGEDSSPIMNKRLNRLVCCVEDIYNILWASKAFVRRMKGRIFYSLTSEHSKILQSVVNLNCSLDILKHMMFEPQRSWVVFDRGLPNRQFSNKDALLDILSERFPHIVELIEIVKEAEQSINEDV